MILALLLIMFLPIFSFAQETWEFAEGHSNIGFAIQWNEFSFRTGEFKKFSGKVETTNAKDYKDAKVNLVINVGGLDVINEQLNKMLMGKEYLDSAACPEITFVCEKLKKGKKNTYLAEGDLTIKCKTIKTTFTVEDMGKKDKYAFIKVVGTVHKKDFGITGGGDRLGDIINITAYLEMKLKK